MSEEYLLSQYYSFYRLWGCSLSLNTSAFALDYPADYGYGPPATDDERLSSTTNCQSTTQSTACAPEGLAYQDAGATNRHTTHVFPGIFS